MDITIMRNLPWGDPTLLAASLGLLVALFTTIMLGASLASPVERRQRAMSFHQRRMNEISAELGELTTPVREAEFLAKLWQGGRANDGDLLALPRHRAAYRDGRQRSLYGGDIALAEARAEYRDGDPRKVREYERTAGELAEQIRTAEAALLAQLRQHADAFERLWREQADSTRPKMQPSFAS